ncbi:MAG: type IV pilus assembly protein PilM [Thermodesulfobacteriota bacterium]|nr:type IV pilus assembly protein PilM [Thermodesulfobacteriota bacterium]
MFGSRKGIVGVDIGASAVKLVQLRESKKGLQLMGLDREPLPPEAVVDDSIMDSSSVVMAIRDLMERNHLKSQDVATSVSGHSVIVRKISLPLMTEDELDKSIQWEAEQYIPFEMSEVFLDYHILGTDPNDQGQMEVILVAAKKDFVDEYMAVFIESGLNPVVMDIDCFAIENIYCSVYDDESFNVVALIDMGASGIQVNILNDMVSVFTREIQLGGNSYNEELQKRFGLNSTDAETLKLGGDVADTDADLTQLALQEVTDKLVQEVRRSIDFFSATFADERVQKIYVTGGVSLTKNIVNSLSDGLDVPVEIMDPFSRMQVNEKDFDLEYVKSVAPFFSVAAGLATRKVGDKL